MRTRSAWLALAASLRATQAARADDAAPEAKEPEVVQVVGRRREIGRTSMSQRESREMPGAFGDPFRAIEVLPGVTPMLSGLSYFFVRGAPPNNNGYFLDGVRVPQLYHLALGPAVIHPALIDHVDLHAGAAPASFGRSAGGIIAGFTREPSSVLHGEANLRLVDAGALVEAPIGERGSALVAGRYGYPGPIVSALSDVDLGYWDYQTRASWRATDRDTLGIFAFGSHDYLAHKDARSGRMVEDLIADFHRVDLRYDRAIKNGRVRIAATLGYDSQGAAVTDGVAPSYLTNTSGAVRLEIDQRLHETLSWRGGLDARLESYGFEQAPAVAEREQVVPSSVNPPPTNVTGGIHSDVVWKLAPRVEVVPGARVDLYSSSRPGVETVTLPAFEPRLATRLMLARGVTWISTAGLAHQYPALRAGILPGALLSGAGFPLGTKRLQQAAQASQGIEVALPEAITASVTGFLSGWTGLTDISAQCFQVEPATRPLPPPGMRPSEIINPYVCPSNAPVSGRGYGVELLVRRAIAKRLSGWLSYTLSRSERAARFLRLDGGEATANVASEFDRTHVLNVVLAYDFGRRWRAGGRFVFYTGTPYSPLSGSLAIPPYNSLRDDPFYRVDVRLEKRWSLGETGSIAFVFEGQNITLSTERSSLGTDCQGEMGEAVATTTCKRASLGPITIPSIGVEAVF